MKKESLNILIDDFNDCSFCSDNSHSMNMRGVCTFQMITELDAKSKKFEMRRVSICKDCMFKEKFMFVSPDGFVMFNHPYSQEEINESHYMLTTESTLYDIYINTLKLEKKRK